MPIFELHPPLSSRNRRGRSALALLFSLTLVVGFVVGCSDDDDASPASNTTSADGSTDDDTAGDEGATSSGSTDDSDETTADGSTDDPDSTDPVVTEDRPELDSVEQSYADAVIANLGDDDEAAIMPGTDNECLIVHWVDLIGADTLEASGLTPEEFAIEGPSAMGIDRATAEKMVDAMGKCGAPIEDSYEDWASLFGIDPDTDPEVVECMREAMTVDDFRETLILAFTGEQSDSMDEAQAEFEACMPTQG